MLDGGAYDASLVGYHCTRLLDNEIHQIKTNGMLPLSQKILAQRINQACQDGYIPNDIAHDLIANNLSRETFRQGTLWFICGCTTLKDSAGIGKFFEAWGGESIYNKNYQKESTWSVISSIGKPCIIKAVLPRNSTRNLSERLIYSFLQSRGVITDNNPQFDACIKIALPSEKIIKIITIDDPDFLNLTT